MKLGGDRNQCQGCRQHFNSSYAFDKHRTGANGYRRCLSTFEMSEKGMIINADGFWISGVNYRTERLDSLKEKDAAARAAAAKGAASAPIYRDGRVGEDDA